MDERASGLVETTSSLKRARESYVPLKKSLIEDMKSQNIKKIDVGTKSINLLEKNKKKTVGEKQILKIVQEQIGEEGYNKVKAAVDAAKGNGELKHSLKIEDR